MENTNQHFTQLEKDCAIDVILRYKGIVENKKTDGVTNKQKVEAWENIAKEYNSSNINMPRSGKQMKNMYENMKRKLKKQISNEKVERYKTGGGPGPSSVMQPSQEKILAAIKGQITPLPNCYDSNKNYCKDTEEISEESIGDELLLSFNEEVNENGQKKKLDQVKMFVDQSLNQSKKCDQTAVKSTKKRTLADVYEEVVSVTSEKKRKLKNKEAYSSINNQHKEEMYEIEKQLKHQEFEHNKMANALKIKILQYEEKAKEIEFKKAEIDLREKEIEFKKKYGC